MEFEDEQQKPGRQVAPGGPAPVTIFLVFLFLVVTGFGTWLLLKAFF